METEVAAGRRAAGVSAQYLPAFAPALMISMGFIDLGKWVVAVEAGSQFGFSPVLLVLLFNCSAVFCQYLATCIAAVTRKNLAQICCEEYDRPAYLLLGIQAEISRIVSEISNILGIAHGFNLVFGMDLLICILLAAIVSVVLPALIKVLGKNTNEVRYAGVSAFVLVVYLLGVLFTQSEAPVAMTGTFPRLSLENSYLVMAILGSNIVVHNFYSQSLLVQQQRRYLSCTEDHILHDHIFAILLVFSGIFLAYFVLMNSATSLYENVGLSVQDVFLLMDQLFTVNIAPVAFFLVLLLSSLISALIWVMGGHVVMDDLLGINASFWVRLTCSKVAVIAPVIYYAGTAGAEGVYLLLIFGQVILAVLLPSSVIPLFRVSSSKLLMGTFTMSWYLEIFAIFTFIWMFSSNLVFLVETLIGSGSWISSLRSSMMLPFAFLLLISFMSLGLTLYLMVTPLRSTSNEAKWKFQKNEQTFIHGRGAKSCAWDFPDFLDTKPEPSKIGPQKLAIMDFNHESAETISHSNDESQVSVDLNLDTASISSASDIVIKGSQSLADQHTVELADKSMSSDNVDLSISAETESNQKFADKQIRVELATDIHTEEDSVSKQADLLEENSLAAVSEDSEALKNPRCNNNDAGSSKGNLSKLPGLGRAARRQFSAILDEFWGHFFDFHGQLTQEARSNKVDILLGLDPKIIIPAKVDVSPNEASRKHLLEERASSTQSNSRDYSFPTQTNVSTKGLSYGYQVGSPSWFSSSQADLYGQRSCNSSGEFRERNYSSLHLPQQVDIRDYQPATIHGYQLSSYFRDIGSGRYETTGYAVDQSLSPMSSEAFMTNYCDQLKFAMEHEGSESLGRFSGTSRVAELPSFDPSFSAIYENPVVTEKKYHSLPDISGLMIMGRNASVNDRNYMQTGSIGTHASMGRSSIGHTQITNPSYRTEGATLPFDELSPSTHYKDLLSSKSSGSETKSLWSRQPYDQLFGMMPDNSQTPGCDIATDLLSFGSDDSSYVESEVKLLKSFKDCITKILKLEGSDWLFKQNAGAHEQLVDQLILKEKILCEIDMNESNTAYFSVYQCLSSDQELSSVQGSDLDFCGNENIVKCGETCIWSAGLIVSFGVWCILRILELSLVESRPELWGKYTYVLNRLQGILEPAFSSPRSSVAPCPCLEIPLAYSKDYGHRLQNNLLQRASMPGGAPYTTSGMILDLIKDVEVAISSRKGRSGTAAGDVAFPKGKENLASVLKRYKRRLSNKQSGTPGFSSSRKFTPPAL